MKTKNQNGLFGLAQSLYCRTSMNILMVILTFGSRKSSEHPLKVVPQFDHQQQLTYPSSWADLGSSQRSSFHAWIWNYSFCIFGDMSLGCVSFLRQASVCWWITDSGIVYNLDHPVIFTKFEYFFVSWFDDR